MRAMPEKCDLPEKNAFNASILFQKSSECKNAFSMPAQLPAA